MVSSSLSNAAVPTQTNKHSEEVSCLAQNIYHEARGEGILGQLAVAWVTLNRVHSSLFPNTVCEVVKQGEKNKRGELKRHRCQFSWYCDGRPDKIGDPMAWAAAQVLALGVISGYNTVSDPTKGALFYHADYVKPEWRKRLKQTTRIGIHIFYKIEAK